MPTGIWSADIQNKYLSNNAEVLINKVKEVRLRTT